MRTSSFVSGLHARPDTGRHLLTVRAVGAGELGREQDAAADAGAVQMPPGDTRRRRRRRAQPGGSLPAPLSGVKGFRIGCLLPQRRFSCPPGRLARPEAVAASLLLLGSRVEGASPSCFASTNRAGISRAPESLARTQHGEWPPAPAQLEDAEGGRRRAGKGVRDSGRGAGAVGDKRARPWSVLGEWGGRLDRSQEEKRAWIRLAANVFHDKKRKAQPCTLPKNCMPHL